MKILLEMRILILIKVNILKLMSFFMVLISIKKK